MPLHPCGLVLDLSRNCNLAGMQLWANLPQVVPGYWFRTEPGALVLEGESVFRKRSTWNQGEVITGVGEQLPPSGGYYNGQNRESYKGVTFCGRLAALRTGGVFGVDPPITTDPRGNSPCCLGGGVQGMSHYQPTVDATGIFWSPIHWPPGDYALFVFTYRESAGVCAVDTIPGWQLLANLPVAGGNRRVCVNYRSMLAGYGLTVRFDKGADNGVCGMAYAMAPFNVRLAGINFGFATVDPAFNTKYTILPATADWPNSAEVSMWMSTGGVIVTGTIGDQGQQDTGGFGLMMLTTFGTGHGPGPIPSYAKIWNPPRPGTLSLSTTFDSHE